MISQSAAAVDLNVDAGTFYVDTTNNRVGVGGKTDPDTPLHVIGTATATTFAGSGASLTDIPNSALTNSSITINSTAVSLGGSLTLTTANIGENTNLYYTDARADARIAAADTDDLSEGSSNLYYTDARVDARVSGGSLGNIITTGYIRGPSSFTIDPAAHGDNTGTVVIAGNLQVDGTTTTINSTTMTVDDKNITLASGSANAAAASGAGFTVDIGTGTNPAITYDGTNDEWDFNKPLNVTGDIAVGSKVKAQYIYRDGSDGSGLHFTTNAIYPTNENADISNGTEDLGAGGYRFKDLYLSGNIAVSGTVDGVDIAARDAVLTSTTTTAGAALPLAGGTMTGGLSIRGFNGPVLKLGSSGISDPRIDFEDQNSTNLGAGIFLDQSADTLRILRTVSGSATDGIAINASGNVGIGKDSPGDKLVVAGDGARMTVESADMEVAMLGRRGSSGTALDQGYLRLRNQGVTADGVVIDSAGSSWLNGGNVGIGITAPNYKLEVLGHTGVRNGSFFIGTETGSNTGGIEFYVPVADPNTLRIYRNVGAFGGTYSAQLGAIELYSGSTYATRITGSGNSFFTGGNVGIGDDNPDNKLVVKDGNIKLKSNADGSTGILMLYDAAGAQSGQVYPSAGDLRIWSPNDVLLLPTGDVGIGTDTPGRQLEIFKAGRAGAYRLKVKGDTGYTGIEIENTSSSNTNLLFRNPSYTQELYMDTSGKFHVYNSSLHRFTVDQDGKVGIGTQSPDTNLHVYKASAGSITASSDAQLVVENSGVAAINLLSGASSHGQILFGDSGDADDGQFGYDQTNREFYFKTAGNSTKRLLINSSGNVGIGTSSPTLKLDLSSSTSFGLPGTSGTTPVGFARIGYTDRTWSGNEILIGIINASENNYAGYIQCKVPTDYSAARPFLINPQGGNVGIGTATPGWQFVVQGAGTGSGLQDGHVMIRSTTAANPAGLMFINSGNTASYNDLGSIQGIVESGNAKGALRFITRNSDGNNTDVAERMRISSNGNVGIGTDDPDARLGIKSSGASSYPLLIKSSDNQQLFRFREESDTRGTFYINDASENSKVTLSSSGNSSFMGGNVGIGTTAPSNLLSLKGQGNNWNTSPALKLWDSQYSKGWYVGTANNQAEGDYYIRSVTSEGAYPVAANKQFTITQEGNVGIGTISPGRPLDVADSGAGAVAGFRGGNNNQVNISHSSNGSWGLLLGNSDSSNNNDYHYSTSGGNNSVAIINVNNDALHLGTNNAARLTIDHNGNTSIGTHAGPTAPIVMHNAVTTVSVRGPIASGYSSGTYAQGPRNTRDWFVYAGPTTNSGQYVHMKTNLWAGGSPAGNSEYTMSSFRYHSYYAYGGDTTPGGYIGWHNWNGGFANPQLVNEGTLALVQNSYRSSDGYVVLVAKIGAGYSQFSIDWMQWAGYPFRERKVTAVTQSSSTSGAY